MRVKTESSGAGSGLGRSLVLLLRLLIRLGLLLAWRRGQRMTVELRRHFLSNRFRLVFLYEWSDRGLGAFAGSLSGHGPAGADGTDQNSIFF